MTAPPPTEVLLVNERKSFPALLVHGLIFLGLDGLLGGFALMLVVPLAAETFHFTRLTPGYWRCVALIVLSRLILRTIVSGARATASGKRVAS